MKNTRKGFTLVELVIVIAVIAILAGVLIATFASVIKRANQSAEVQNIKNAEIAQKADDIIKKIEESNWFGWEDFEASIVAKIAEVVKTGNAGANTPLTSDQVRAIVEDALTTVLANEGNTGLTVDQVKTVVENALGTLKYEGVTEAQVRAIVKAASNEVVATQLTAAQVRSIVTTANANNLTAADIIVALGSANIATASDITDAVGNVTTAIGNATAGLATSAQVEELKGLIEDISTTVLTNDLEDVVIAKSLNIKLAKSNKAISTPSDVVAVTQSNPVSGVSTDNLVLLDLENKTFVVVKNETGYPVVYATNITVNTSLEDTYKYWTFESVTGTSVEYSEFSVYLLGSPNVTSATLNGVGLDVGENTDVSTIKYNGVTTDRSVVIRTNGGTLTIDAEYNTVNHYGEGQVLDIKAIAGSSYHEFGHFPKATIKQGRMVVEDKGQVEILNVTGAGVVLDQVGTGSVELCYASSNENIPTGNATVEATVATIELDNIVARTENGAYSTLSDALDNLGTSKTLYIVADFSETFTATSGTAMYSISSDLIIDGQNHTINATFVINNTATKIFMDVTNSNVAVKNLNIVGIGVKYIIVADDDSDMTFDNINITADNAGISASNGHAVAKNSTFRFIKGEHTRNDYQEAWAPVSAQYGGTVELFDCVLTSSDGYGMLIWPSGGTLEATRCSITSAKGYAVSWIRNCSSSNTPTDSIIRVNNCTIEGSTSCEAKYNSANPSGREAYVYKDGVLVATTVSE